MRLRCLARQAGNTSPYPHPYTPPSHPLQFVLSIWRDGVRWAVGFIWFCCFSFLCCLCCLGKLRKVGAFPFERCAPYSLFPLRQPKLNWRHGLCCWFGIATPLFVYFEHSKTFRSAAARLSAANIIPLPPRKSLIPSFFGPVHTGTYTLRDCCVLCSQILSDAAFCMFLHSQSSAPFHFFYFHCFFCLCFIFSNAVGSCNVY